VGVLGFGWLLKGGVAFLLGRGYRTTANPQPGLMDDDLRFYGATGLRWDSVPSQRSAARLSKDTAKDEVGRFGEGD
jgi:hypothetical protein